MKFNKLLLIALISTIIITPSMARPDFYLLNDLTTDQTKHLKQLGFNTKDDVNVVYETEVNSILTDRQQSEMGRLKSNQFQSVNLVDFDETFWLNDLTSEQITKLRLLRPNSSNNMSIINEVSRSAILTEDQRQQLRDHKGSSKYSHLLLTDWYMDPSSKDAR